MKHLLIGFLAFTSLYSYAGLYDKVARCEVVDGFNEGKIFLILQDIKDPGNLYYDSFNYENKFKLVEEDEINALAGIESAQKNYEVEPYKKFLKSRKITVGLTSKHTAEFGIISFKENIMGQKKRFSANLIKGYESSYRGPDSKIIKDMTIEGNYDLDCEKIFH